MKPIAFVSGIDTNIGKTVVTGLMARFLREHAIRAITVKPVQTGNDGMSEDIAEHRRIMGCGLLPEDETGLTYPQLFHFPASPHLAAQLENRTVDVCAVEHAIGKIEQNYDFMLIEGAGGLLVPLTEKLLTIDWIAEHQWPLILVTSGRLGSLNHTLLSVEAARSRGIALAGIVFNYDASADEVTLADTMRMTRKYLDEYYHLSVPLAVCGKYSCAETPDFSMIFDGEVLR
ncbi:MAG: dethiobiotin synthase [Victivallaceae bacterium]|nr:dethiobiotin synthase [Victivallaceae bacterium]